MIRSLLENEADRNIRNQGAAAPHEPPRVAGASYPARAVSFIDPDLPLDIRPSAP